MKKETFERQRAYAGEKKPSMLRRCVGHDYTGRQMYMITMVTEGRRPLLGTLVGDVEAPPETPQAPHVELSELGKRVEEEWWATATHHPEIKVVALQMMPDHLHGILFVQEKLEKPLGMALRGFKQSCNQHYRRLVLGEPPVPSAPPSVPFVAVSPSDPFVALSTQQTERNPPAKRDRRGEQRTHGLLFARGYNDRLLLRAGQLDTWLAYLRDNPRRLMVKRQHPDFFRVSFNLRLGSQTYSALGNHFLLSHPLRRRVQCSRKLTEAEIDEHIRQALNDASQGIVHVSPAISPGEKAVMRALLDAGHPLIFLEGNGLTPYTKPSHRFFAACARGQLLILSPWEHHNEQQTITRDKCLTLNTLAQEIERLPSYACVE